MFNTILKAKITKNLLFIVINQTIVNYNILV